MSGVEWALDPWSDEPRWIAVPLGMASYLIPEPDAGPWLLTRSSRMPRVSRVDRYQYWSSCLGDVAALGPPGEVGPLLERAEIAILLVMALKRITT